MRRRQFIASGTALLSAALAGCAHPDAVLDLNEATASDIADEVSTSADPGSDEYAVVSSVVENGSATRTGRSALFDRVDAVRFEGSFYDVSENRLRSEETTAYAVRLDFDPADPEPELGEIDYADLPEVDREHLDPVITDHDRPSQEGYDVGIEYGTAEDVGNESVFVPEPQYDIVVRDGDRIRVDVESRAESEATYRYEATQVAPSVDAFADRVRDRYLFALSGLSDAEREVVEEAIDGAYFQEDDAFQSVVERIREHDGIREDDFYGTWLLEYEGSEYVTYVEW